MALLKSLIVGWLALTGSVPQIAAEIYRFDKAEVPAPHSLHVKHLFYAWAKEKSETNVAQWPVLSGADVHISDASGAELTQAYKSVQLSMVPWGDFHKLIDASVICGGKPETGFLSLQKYPSKAWVISMTVPARKNTSITKKIFKTSVYALVLSNCGTQSDLKISGSISVKNPYGFLPGHEYYRLPFYGWVTLFWAGAGVIWLTLLVAKKHVVVWAHIALAGIIIIGFGESVAWWFSLSTVNSTGEAPGALLMSEMLSVMRNTCALTFILVASMGLGVTEADLDQATKIKVLVGSTLFGVFAALRVYLAHMQQAVNPKTSIVILANLPVFIVGLFQFIWILRCLAHSMRRSKDLNQADSLKIFQRLGIILSICMLSAVGVMLGGQFMDKPSEGPQYWQSHVFWNDGVCQGVVLLTLFATMYFLAPSPSGFLAESYMMQGDEKEETGLTDEPAARDDDGKGGDGGGKQDGSLYVVGGEGDPEEGAGGSQPSANTIGARS